MVIYFFSLFHLRIYELAADLRLYFGAGEKKDLEARLREMIPLSEVAAKLKQIEDSERDHMAELEERKEAFVKRILSVTRLNMT